MLLPSCRQPLRTRPLLRSFHALRAVPLVDSLGCAHTIPTLFTTPSRGHSRHSGWSSNNFYKIAKGISSRSDGATSCSSAGAVPARSHRAGLVSRVLFDVWKSQRKYLCLAMENGQ